MNTSFMQLELPLVFVTPATPSAFYLDWPLQPLPGATMASLRQLSTRWSRSQTGRRARKLKLAA